MSKTLEPLDHTRHKDLRLSGSSDLSFVATTMTVPLGYTEVIAVAQMCPIVFAAEGVAQPYALLSLQPNSNAFIENGRWTGTYLPAHLRRYPFMLAASQPPDRMLVLIDRAAPHFATGEGEVMFEDDGQPTESLTRMIDFLKVYQTEMQYSCTLFQPLIDTGILVAQGFEVTPPGGIALRKVEGFRAVDADKFAALPDQTIIEWRKSGLLPLVYAHLASLQNIDRLAKAITQASSLH